MRHKTLLRTLSAPRLLRLPLSVTVHHLIFVSSIFRQPRKKCIIILFLRKIHAQRYLLTELGLNFVKVFLEHISVVLHAAEDGRHLEGAVFLHVLVEDFGLGSEQLFLVVVNAFLHFDFLQVHHTRMHRRSRIWQHEILNLRFFIRTLFFEFKVRRTLLTWHLIRLHIEKPIFRSFRIVRVISINVFFDVPNIWIAR